MARKSAVEKFLEVSVAASVKLAMNEVQVSILDLYKITDAGEAAGRDAIKPLLLPWSLADRLLISDAIDRAVQAAVKLYRKN